MQATSLQFMALAKLKLPLVNQFYKRVYKKGLASREDAVFVLYDKQIVCTAKLKNIGEQLLLTGVACEENLRGKGYASLLIKQILLLQKQPIYCFPYAHLIDFYLRLGFVPLERCHAPAIIAEKFHLYSKTHKLLLMVYLPNSANKDE